MIRLRDLHKYFNRGKQNELHVLDGVSLELPERGMVAIFGRSGCGKTTLLNVIGGLDRYASGSVTVEGREISEDPDGIRCRYMGYVFQNYNLRAGETCFENVAAALYLSGMRDGDEVARRVRAALRNVGMEKYERRTPETLSGGQQQRIAIARAIVKNPRIILADEPTGNLDEANTVMIMDLLRELANEHLVLLVTHEEALVHRYADLTVELSDGRISCIRENEAGGGRARSKNDVWLGELARRELSEGDLRITSYGDEGAEPLCIRIVRSEGKTLLRVDSPGVEILDGGSEIRLREGCFAESEAARRAETHIDMSELPPFEGERHGRLFRFPLALRESLHAALRDRKRGKRILSACMCLFSAALVLMTALFGTAFARLSELDAAYHHSVFYVYDADGTVSPILKAAGDEAAIGEMRLSGSTSPLYISRRVAFSTAFFETFSDFASREIATDAVLLGDATLRGMPLVCGRSEALSESEAVITSAVAEALLDSSPLSFLNAPEDLLGIAMTEPQAGLRIVGVVRSGEPAIYLNRLTAAQLAMAEIPTGASLASLHGWEIGDGHTALALRAAEDGITYPAVGESITVHGERLTVDRILRYAKYYEEWMLYSGITPLSKQTFFAEKLALDYPDLQPDEAGRGEAYADCLNRYFYEYAAAYSAHIDRFAAEQYLFAPSLTTWLLLEKGIGEARGQLITICDGDELLLAEQFRSEHGRYPTLSEVHEEGVLLTYRRPSDTFLTAVSLYEEEYYSSPLAHLWGCTYLVSDGDYCAIAEGFGETDPSASYLVSGTPTDAGSYLQILSRSPARTEAYLKKQFPALWKSEAGDGSPLIVSPSRMRESLRSEMAGSVAANLVSLAVGLAVMSLAMYFIMRSSLLAHVKEIGVWRAIGVSRRNIVFRFLVEAGTLATVTALPGYLVTSGLLALGSGKGSMLSSLLYYPAPLALALLALLYGVCLLTGILPVLLLLRKTPSEIIAKYDI